MRLDAPVKRYPGYSPSLLLRIIMVSSTSSSQTSSPSSSSMANLPVTPSVTHSAVSAIIRPNQSLTAREAWLQIERLFHDHVSSRTLQLKVQFHNLKKGSLSIADYVHRLKSISDALTSIGNPISDSDLILQILSGLPSEYLSISTSISTRVPLSTFLETRSLMFLHETQLTGFSSTASDSSTALVAKQNSSSQGRGRGRNSNGGRYAYGGRGRGRNNNGYQRSYSTAPPQFAPRQRAPSILGPAPHSTISSVYPTYPFPSSF
ncbi:PREDICTED: uncharacterized protein LOC109209806 [Nicotiana attenuata]|uniref:uncharacterized protein LOC109209806 n=1 Tax=Nicotiana attenuata TaxID=49451 RepID=UPI000904FC02|nr:PREDICTED: uncharacterized protein LOC109209806 [Nicotiana attenuata]